VQKERALFRVPANTRIPSPSRERTAKSAEEKCQRRLNRQQRTEPAQNAERGSNRIAWAGRGSSAASVRPAARKTYPRLMTIGPGFRRSGSTSTIAGYEIRHGSGLRDVRPGHGMGMVGTARRRPSGELPLEQVPVRVYVQARAAAGLSRMRVRDSAFSYHLRQRDRYRRQDRQTPGHWTESRVHSAGRSHRLRRGDQRLDDQG
jgi:hypothetical protein